MGCTSFSLHGSERLLLALTSRATAPDAYPCSPSVQHECIPQAILGMDILCQAKSGMGKTAVFVLATLQQIEPVNGQVGDLLPPLPLMSGSRCFLQPTALFVPGFQGT